MLEAVVHEHQDITRTPQGTPGTIILSCLLACALVHEHPGHHMHAARFSVHHAHILVADSCIGA